MIANTDASRPASMVRGLRAELLLDRTHIDDLTAQLRSGGSLGMRLSIAESLVAEYEALLSRVNDRLMGLSQDIEADSASITSAESTHVRREKFLSAGETIQVCLDATLEQSRAAENNKKRPR